MKRLGMMFLASLALTSCLPLQRGAEEKPRLVLFVGVDISGSFLNSTKFTDGIEFLSHYLYAHLMGYGGLDKPSALYVGSLGGARPGEPKTFYPIQTFENMSPSEIKAKLIQLFPKERPNPFTDYNAFFEQVGNTVREKKMVLKPLSIVLLSDGQPDTPGKKGEKGYRGIRLAPLEELSRNITIRLLYTDAVVAKGWKENVPRKRVKIWTQDASVMKSWKNPKIFDPGRNFPLQERFFAWTRDNVDFNVRAKRVD